MKKFYLISLLSLLFACSENTENEGNKDADYNNHVKISLEKTVIQPFEKTDIKFTNTSMDELVTIFDSVKFEYDKENLWTGYGFSFIGARQPGDYKIYFKGYKNNKVYSDYVLLQVTKPKGDFFNTIWADSPIFVNRIYENNFMVQYSKIEGQIVFIEPTLLGGQPYIKDSEYLHNFLTSYYGDSNYNKANTSKEELISLYQERFEKDGSQMNYKPLEIWDLPNSYAAIALYPDVDYALVIATPKK